MKKLTLVSLVLVLVMAFAVVASAASPMQSGHPDVAAIVKAYEEAAKEYSAWYATQIKARQDMVAARKGIPFPQGDLGGVFTRALAESFVRGTFNAAQFELYITGAIYNAAYWANWGGASSK